METMFDGYGNLSNLGTAFVQGLICTGPNWLESTCNADPSWAVNISFYFPWKKQ